MKSKSTSLAVDVTRHTHQRAGACGRVGQRQPVASSGSATHPVYDTTRVEGAALMDDDFVEEAAEELDRCTTP